MQKWEEQILVVDRDVLFEKESLHFQGVSTEKEKVAIIWDNIEKNYQVMRRGDKKDPTPKEHNAEINFDFKQPIPYALLRKGQDVFVYRRLGGGGESRLHEKLSMGVGGHMNPINGLETFKEVLMENLDRELEEELSISSSSRELEVFGLINDDENEVGRVHIGVLLIINLSDDAVVEVKEKDQLEGSWMNVEALLQEETFSKLEPWSQIATKAL